MKALIFDLDDTLYDQIQPFGKAVRQYMTVPDDEMEALYLAFRHCSDAVFAQSVSGQISMKDMHIYRMQTAFSEIGRTISKNVAVAIQESYAHQQEQLTLMPGSQELFAYCKEHQLALGLITNGPYEHQLKKIQSLHLSDWIAEDLMIISGQVGFFKPDVAIFRMMEERIGLLPQDLCYVGDSFENDVLGAKAAGWQAVWFNHRKRLATHPHINADVTVTELKAVQDWLQQ